MAAANSEINVPIDRGDESVSLFLVIFGEGVPRCGYGTKRNPVTTGMIFSEKWGPFLEACSIVGKATMSSL
jgi:hypothetical protein